MKRVDDMNTERSLFPKLTRRQFFKIGTTTFAGYALAPLVRPFQVAATQQVQPRDPPSFASFSFLMGGPPQLDTFDVKEGKWTPEDFDIRTIAPGIKMPFGQFPRLSERIHHLALARSVEAWESIHERGQYYVQAGRAFSGARAKEIPSVGSIVAYEFEPRRNTTDFLPPFVAMNFGPGVQV